MEKGAGKGLIKGQGELLMWQIAPVEEGEGMSDSWQK